MSPFLIRKQMTQEHIPMIDERCGDAVGIGVLVVTRTNAIVIELKDLRPWQSEQYRRMGGDDELRALFRQPMHMRQKCQLPAGGQC